MNIYFIITDKCLPFQLLFEFALMLGNERVKQVAERIRLLFAVEDIATITATSDDVSLYDEQIQLCSLKVESEFCAL